MTHNTFLEMMGLLESTDIVSIEPTVGCKDLVNHDYYEEVEQVLYSQ